MARLENKISKLIDNQKHGILIEVGAGCPVYNLLCQYPNTASKLIHYAESPNNWQYSQNKYGHQDRAISPQVCENMIIYHVSKNKNPDVNFILTNTIQISNSSETETHGWFGLYENRFNTLNIKYFHFYIEPGKTRKESIDIIGEIGISILNGELHNCIDIVLDQNFNDDLYTLLNGKLNTTAEQNTITVINKHNKLIRLTEFLRNDFSELCVMKGSFNPLHDQHINLLEHSKSDSSYGVFCISLNHRHKDRVDIDNLIKRIKIINELGYSVFIDTNGYYINNYNSIINNVSFKNKQLKYVLGTDVLNRVIEDIDMGCTIKGDFIFQNEIYDKCIFAYLERDNDTIKIPDYINLNVQKLDFEPSSISSTKIRQYLELGDLDNLKSLVSENLFNLYRKHFNI